MACAHRDGIVDSTLERATKGPQGVTALPLLNGNERVCSPSRAVKYSREGKLSEMHLCLISQVGKQIRILRGYRLHSPLAPRAGVRYDGWCVRSRFRAEDGDTDDEPSAGTSSGNTVRGSRKERVWTVLRSRWSAFPVSSRLKTSRRCRSRRNSTTGIFTRRSKAK